MEVEARNRFIHREDINDDNLGVRNSEKLRADMYEGLGHLEEM